MATERPSKDDARRIPLGVRLRRFARFACNLSGVRAALRPRFGDRPNAATLHRVAIFPELGIAYNRIKKNANTTLTIQLRALAGGGDAHRDLAKWEALTPLDLGPGERALLERMRWIVVVRDPFSRTLSAFLDKFRDEKYRRKHGAFPLTPEGYRDFLRYLDAGGLTRDAHWDLQSRLLVGSLEAFDSVLRFETLGPDLEAALAAAGIAFDAGQLRTVYPSDESKQTGAAKRMSEFYSPEAEALVARLFATDFQKLGYPDRLRPAVSNAKEAAEQGSPAI